MNPSGIGLMGDSGECLMFDIASWKRAMLLARRYGWRPAGTEAPAPDAAAFDGEPHRDPTSWSGSYEQRAGQHVTQADARNLAEALHDALPDVPDDVPADAAPAAQRASILESFGGDGKRLLEAIVSVSRAGGFTIQ